MSEAKLRAGRGGVGRGLGGPGVGPAGNQTQEFRVWIPLSSVWSWRGWVPPGVKVTFLLQLPGLNLVAVRDGY